MPREFERLRTFSHPNAAYGAAFSADGNTLATASLDNTVRLWDPATGDLRATLRGHGDGVAFVGYTADGERLVTASLDRSLKLWSRDGASLLATLSGHQDYLACANVSPVGSLLASGGFDKTVRLWDATSGSAVATLTGHEDTVQCLSFSSDGRSLYSGGDDGTIRVWDTQTKKHLGTLTGHIGSVEGLACSRDGLLASVGVDATLRLWAADGTAVATLDSKALRLRCVAFAPDGQWLLTGGTPGILESWDVAARKHLTDAAPHRNTIYSTAFRSDGMQFATASFDREIHLWQVVVKRDS